MSGLSWCAGRGCRGAAGLTGPGSLVGYTLLPGPRCQVTHDTPTRSHRYQGRHPVSYVSASENDQSPAPGPDCGRIFARPVLSRVGVADHALTLEAPWTGSGWREYFYGGFGGGHSSALIRRDTVETIEQRGGRQNLLGRSATGVVREF
jgi:hypothetical protein